jgi:hypothetical protein
MMIIMMMVVKKVLAVVVEVVWSCFKSQMDKRGKRSRRGGRKSGRRRETRQ